MNEEIKMPQGQEHEGRDNLYSEVPNENREATSSQQPKQEQSSSLNQERQSPFGGSPSPLSSQQEETPSKTKRDERSPETSSVYEVDEDEIDLMDYIRVIWKRKIGIIAVFIIAVLAAGLISKFVLPEVYETSSLVEIAKIKGENLENPADIIATFKQRAILLEIAEKVGWDKEKETDRAKIRGLESNLKLEKGEKGNFLKIKAKANTPEEAQKIVSAVNDILISRHKKRFTEAERLVEAEIETIKQDKEKTKKDIEKIQQSLGRISRDIAIYEKEIAKRGNIKSEGQGRIVESYIKLLAQAKDQKEAKEAKILALEQKLVGLEQSIQQKEYERAYETTMTRVVVPPLLPERPVEPRTMVNVAIAGILGLFIGILWAFGAEYIEKNKERV